MDFREILRFAFQLAHPKCRREAAQKLAVCLGGDELFIFVRDEELDTFLPARGLPQTIPGGSGWADLLLRCRMPGEHRGVVAYPDKSSSRPARALATADGIAVAILGEAARLPPVEALCLPLLASMMRAEFAAEAAAGRERAAREEARQAATVTSVLDATRAELERSLGVTRHLLAELKAADHAKDEFLAMLAHELRNPLAPLVSTLDLLRHQGPSAPAFGRHLDVLDRQVRHLKRLVEDLLDVSRISRGLIVLQREPIEVRGLLLQAVDGLRPLLESERHSLSLSLSEKPLYVLADAVRLSQVFANLLTNAVKYTDPGGRIEVSLRRAGDRVEICVRDNGIGIEPDMLPRIFDLFTQAPRALDRSKGGLGIGLTLVKRLVALHHGSITVRSEGVGKGSDFTVDLPLVAPPPKVAPSSEPSVSSSPRAMRILLIEDNADAADMLGEVLRLQGCSVRIARDGEQGIAAAAEFAPELVLVDIGLPKLDGYAVAKELRARMPFVRIIALSGYGGEEYRARGRSSGFDAYLVKPVELEDLLAVLRGDLGNEGT